MRPTPQKILGPLELPAFLITHPIHVRFVTGVTLDDSCILVTPKRFILFVDVFAEPTAKATVPPSISIRRADTLGRFLQGIPECGFEADHVTVARRARWKKFFPATTFTPRTDTIERFRRRKDDEELRCLRRAERITGEILGRVPAILRSGVTEEAVARKLLQWAIELGADGLAFPPIVAFGTNTASPHHRPTRRTLRRGHIVQIDVGARYRCYCGDMSDVFFTAKPTRAQAQVYATLLDAQARAMKAVKPGVTTHALDRIAREVLRKAGLEEAFSHSLGHGVGLEIHEGPVLSQKRPPMELLEREVVTIEPGVYFPERFGMRVERMVVVR